MSIFKKKIENKISFRAWDEYALEVMSKPQPASDHLPDWWKKMPNYSGPNTMSLSPAPNVTVKRCMPSFDALTAGYIFTLWTDIQVSYTEETGSVIRWGTSREPFSPWPAKQVSTYEIPDGFDNHVFKYHYGYDITTPSGWSSLFVHPVAYQNLPFRVIPGLVDTDVLKTDINTPLVFKKGFEGVIEKGTPMFQLIPLYRQNWTSEVILQDPAEHYLNQEKLNTRIVSPYGRYMRTPKIYK
jgi:hypothetical protein